MKKPIKRRLKNEYEITFWRRGTECIFVTWYTTYTKKEAIAKAKKDLMKVLRVDVSKAPNGDMD